MEDDVLVKICEYYFGKKRAEEYQKNPDDRTTDLLIDIYDYGYDRAIAKHHGDDYDPSYSVDLGGKTLV